MNSTNPRVGKKPIRQALEDAVVVGFLALLGGLIVNVNNWPLDAHSLYAAGVSALLAGTLAYARARKIQQGV